MTSTTTFRGFCTQNFSATDLDAAKKWYSQLFGIEPYFNRPEYIEFRLGDYQQEFGILDRRYHPGASDTPAGAVAYWHVDNINAVYERLLAMGATAQQPPRDFGHGFIGATVVDPFGNILGVMYNPHYLEILAATKPS